MNQWWAIVMLLSGGLFAGSVGRSPGNPSRLAARRPGRLPDLLRRPLCQVNCRSRPCWPFACLHQLGLTPRDREALALVANGRSNRQITEALFVSPKTAGVHLSNILAKLGVAGRVDRPPPRPRLLVAEATPAPGPRLPLPTTSHQAMTSPICD
jgi:Bacterial regulatory proteins, luxR family